MSRRARGKRSPRAPRPSFDVIVSVGPASRRYVRQMVASGVRTFRLNASHLPGRSLRVALRRLLADVSPASIVVDLQGAKMRLGELRPRRLRIDRPVVFAVTPTQGEVPLPHPEFFAQVAVGDVMQVDDDRLHLEVTAVDSARVQARPLSGGTLLGRKGVSVRGRSIHLSGLSRGDARAVSLCREYGVARFALSFMEDGHEAEWVRLLAPRCEVVGKVERAEAVGALSRMAKQVDSLWICRGDLQAEVGVVAMAELVGQLSPSALGCPVYMAGQVLEHLTAHDEPTRSEVCHFYDLVRRGYAGVVLSDETAIGKDAVRAATVARELAQSFCCLDSCTT